MSLQGKAFILRHTNPDQLKVISPYNAGFVEELKSTLGYTARRWDPLEKCWIVNRVYLEELVAILKKHYEDIQTDLLETEDRTSPNPFYAMFALLEDRGQAKRIFRVLAQAFHPDTGGSDQRMKELNEAYNMAEKRFDRMIANTGEKTQ